MRITAHGCNLLGLANFFAFLGVVAFAPMIISPVSPVLGAVVMGLGVCGCCVFDFALRILTGSGGRLMRLLSPHAGGAIFYIPVWVVYPAMAIFGLVMVLHGN
jgi:hypothetical protein